MQNFQLDSVLLDNFRKGIMAAASGSQKVYQLGSPAPDLGAAVDSLINSFVSGVIQDALHYVAQNTDFRFRCLDIASKYELPIDYVENYVLDSPNTEDNADNR